MKQIPSYIIALSIFFAGGCHTSQTVSQISTAKADSARVQISPNIHPPAAIVDNVTHVEAVINKMHLEDSIHYSLTLFILTSSPISGRMSLIEPQQTVTVGASYLMDEEGNIDLTLERNMALYSARTKVVGERITGTISLDHWGAYNLLTVERN